MSRMESDIAFIVLYIVLAEASKNEFIAASNDMTVDQIKIWVTCAASE